VIRNWVASSHPILQVSHIAVQAALNGNPRWMSAAALAEFSLPHPELGRLPARDSIRGWCPILRDPASGAYRELSANYARIVDGSIRL
jgi:hypothetical protein